MNILYNFGIYTYKQLVNIASFRNLKARKMKQGHKEIFHYLAQNADPEGGYIWIHASSLGEFEQGRPIIEAIKAHYPEQKIAITFFSPSGYEVRKNYPKADLICYLPFDLPNNVNRFLNILKPKQAIFIKYEFWGNYLNALAKRNIPTYIISAIFRPSQIFFRPYGSYFRRILQNFEHLYVQDENSKKLLKDIGITKVSVTGDTRFDRVLEIRSQAKELPLIEQFSKGNFTLIAGSSWPKDEEIFIDYFNRHPEMKLIIAPHEIHEEHIQFILSRLNRTAIRYTQADEKNIQKADCIIIDCFGLLSSIYRYGQVAYVGGGFGAGIHNVPEAAVYGIPVIFGPNHKKFKEAKELIIAGGGFSISRSEDFELVMDRLLENKEFLSKAGITAGQYIQNKSGASKKILKELYPEI
ncbi:MAG TPA: 3-deoxy-D-manno-octulosonic acid transferase [Coprobacter fastidiosus]|uniref:3-deoxy-D-manno-octulosonic acid transferase n=1 Tax=Coprobacter fastidiosus TaxID=1099853 RepID=A0A354LZ16_9BACT|nr:3-deoxy-D-manno-octulosonic acid transferase [Coprobacter fastidiosus]